MKFKQLRFFASIALLALASGCAIHPTVSGGDKTILLAGAIDVTTKPYAPVPATSLDVDTTTLLGYGVPSEAKVSLLWGLISIHDS